MQAQEEHIERRQRTDEKCRLPAKRRNQKIGNARRCKPAQSPKTLKENNEATAQACGGILTHQCRRHRQLPSQTKAHEEAEHKQRLIVPRHGTQSRRYAVEENRDRKHLLAPDAVCNRPREHRTKSHPNQPNRANPPRLCGRKTPLAREHRQNECDQPCVHRIKQPAKPRHSKQLVLESAKRQILQPIQNHETTSFMACGHMYRRPIRERTKQALL